MRVEGGRYRVTGTMINEKCPRRDRAAQEVLRRARLRAPMPSNKWSILPRYREWHSSPGGTSLESSSASAASVGGCPWNSSPPRYHHGCDLSHGGTAGRGRTRFGPPHRILFTLAGATGLRAIMYAAGPFFQRRPERFRHLLRRQEVCFVCCGNQPGRLVQESTGGP